MVVSGAIAAALALPGCAPQGYDAADYGANAAPEAEAAGNVVEAAPTPSAGVEEDPAAEEESAEKDAEKAPTVAEEDLTTELTGKKVNKMGEVIVDQDGWILYRFDQDKVDPAKSNCNDECARVWPPSLTDGEPELDGVSSDDVGTVTRDDGTKQITVGGWAMYRYVGDKKPGQWLGQNVGGKWFVAKPNGEKNLTCMPEISKAVAPPPLKDEKKAEKAKATGTDSATEYSY
jgi:predicted lipoprotein with Yx(FWY)xxD motif